MINGAQNQGFDRNNLVGTRYGTTGNTGRNLAGGDGNTGNDPSNFLGRNGVNTIENNNRFGRMGNTGTGMGNNGYNTGNNGFSGMLTGNGRANAMNGNDRARASMIERQLESISGINDCSVIVSGDTALVGLRTNGTGAGNMSGLRAAIESRVKQMDRSIRNVTVTDSPDMLTRMGRLGTTGNGMTNNFMQEFDNMIRSLNNVGR
jgi:YhcN/YlaJ family sporulation lipoprotein